MTIPLLCAMAGLIAYHLAQRPYVIECGDIEVSAPTRKQAERLFELAQSIRKRHN